MAAVETVEYRGLTFRRYPDATGWADRNYYRVTAPGVEALHREVYKDHFGAIPDGCDVHHRDGDTSNNDPSNLECLTSEEHQRIHAAASRERGSTPEWREHLERIRPLTVEWHRSEAGRQWHREHGARTWDGKEPHAAICEHCGAEFATRATHGNGRFCSNNCKTKWRKASGVDDVERQCAACGSTFTVNRYSATKCCSRSCAWTLRRAK